MRPGSRPSACPCGRHLRLCGRVRAALLLNVLDGYTQAEIARMLDVPAGTVASWIASGKARLREELSDG